MAMKWALPRAAGYDAGAETGTVVITNPGQGPVSIVFSESGTVTGGYSFDIELSHDGENFAMYDTDVTAEEYHVLNGPIAAVKITCGTWVGGTGDIYVTVGWQV